MQVPWAAYISGFSPGERDTGTAQERLRLAAKTLLCGESLETSHSTPDITNYQNRL